MTLSIRQNKALAALIECPTQASAAQAAGITTRTMRRFLADEEFQAEYRKATAQLVADATRRLQQAVSSAIDTLLDVMSDSDVQGSVRVSAARGVLDSALRYSEFNDVLLELRKLEGE